MQETIVVEAVVMISGTLVLGFTAVKLSRGRTLLDTIITGLVTLRAVYYLLEDMYDAALSRRVRWPEYMDRAWSKR